MLRVNNEYFQEIRQKVIQAAQKSSQNDGNSYNHDSQINGLGAGRPLDLHELVARFDEEVLYFPEHIV
jgi:hypothetical protein